MQEGHQRRICIISTIKNAHIIRWCRILLSKGYDISLISSEHDNWGISDIKVIECLPVRSKFHFYDLYHQLVHAIKIHLLLRKIKPDVVHIHSLDYIHPFMFFIVNIINGISDKLIISPWGTDIIGNAESNSSKRGKFSKKLLLKQAAEITATSKYLASKTAAIAPRGKLIHVIPFGVDLNLFYKKKRKNRSDKICIGFIKHLKPKYGPDVLLKAFAIIFKDFENLTLVMVGHGEMEEELKKMATRLGIRDSVKFTGYLQNEQIPDVLEKMDIFAMPSIIEAFGVAALEAQAMEIPVVASKVGGISEVILHKETGILVEPKNVEQLASALKMLIENSNMRDNMGEAGRRFVVKNYNLEDNVLLFGRLYQKLNRSL